MWDLTVSTDHDFNVDVATTAVLVHNCEPDEENPWAKPPPEQDPPRSQWRSETRTPDMRSPGEASEPDNPDLTNAGRGVKAAYVFMRLIETLGRILHPYDP
jgi:hypothetical protein